MPYLSSQFIIKAPINRGGDIGQVGDLGWLEFYGGQGLRGVLTLRAEKLQIAFSYGIKLYIFLF